MYIAGFQVDGAENNMMNLKINDTWHISVAMALKCHLSRGQLTSAWHYAMNIASLCKCETLSLLLMSLHHCVYLVQIFENKLSYLVTNKYLAENIMESYIKANHDVMSAPSTSAPGICVHPVGDVYKRDISSKSSFPHYVIDKYSRKCLITYSNLQHSEGNFTRRT